MREWGKVGESVAKYHDGNSQERYRKGTGKGSAVSEAYRVMLFGNDSAIISPAPDPQCPTISNSK